MYSFLAFTIGYIVFVVLFLIGHHRLCKINATAVPFTSDVSPIDYDEPSRETDLERKHMHKLIRVSMLCLVTVLGCRSGLTQVPKPTTPAVPLTCNAPVSFVAGSGNGFVFSRATCTSATNCPQNIAGNSSFVALNASPVAACSYLDTPPPNSLVIYTVSTVQGGLTSLPSSPSNSGTPSAIPMIPSAPNGLSGAVQTSELAPALPPLKPQPSLPVSASLTRPTGLTAGPVFYK